MAVTFKILRYDPTKDEPPRFQTYVHEPKPRDSVMESLKDIRDQQDPSLSFRYSCREAVCGSCAIVINGAVALSCRTLVEASGPQIVLEPLPNMEILRDLVVDMAPFWEAYRFVQPYLQPEGEAPAKGHRFEDAEFEDVFRLTTCILCASCYAACPVVSREAEYLGPAALAKLHRFIKDPRDKRPFAALKRVDSATGAWGCDTVFRCNDVCPKEVQPAHGIEGVRRALVAKSIKRVFRRNP